MKGRNLAIYVVLVMVLAAGIAATLLPPLREARGIAPPNAASFAANRAMFAGAFSGEARWEEQSRKLGLEARRDPEAMPGLLLTEPKGACFGRGAYLIRQDAGAVPLAVTAPHRGADRHTGTLAVALYHQIGAAAASWNSAPRKPSKACPAGLDLAREPQHGFTAFALAFAAAHPDGRVVQLHGFDGARRGELEASEAAAILSDGTNDPVPALLDLADCLSRAIAPRAVLVYPIETGELGALGNAQGRALREAGFRGFVHLEMSGDLRRELVQDTALFQRFGACLAGGLG